MNAAHLALRREGRSHGLPSSIESAPKSEMQQPVTAAHQGPAPSDCSPDLVPAMLGRIRQSRSTLAGPNKATAISRWEQQAKQRSSAVRSKASHRPRVAGRS